METITSAFVKQLNESLVSIIDPNKVLDDLAKAAETDPSDFHYRLTTVLGWWKLKTNDQVSIKQMEESLRRVDVNGVTIPEGPYFKVINSNYVQKGFKYQLGLNVDTVPFNPSGSCNPGGLYFATALNLPAFFKYGTLIVKVTIPDKAKVHVEKNKIKADMIEINDPVEIKDWSYWSDNEYCSKIIVKYPDTFTYVKNKTEELYLKLLSHNVEYIDHIPKEHINDNMLGVVLQVDGSYIRHIPEQKENLCLIAVENSPRSIRYIKKPTDNVILAAIKRNRTAAEFVKSPVSDVVFRYILENILLSILTCSLSDEQYFTAINHNVDNFKHIKNPSIEIIKHTLSKNGLFISNISRYTEEMAKIAINQNPEVIQYIGMQTEELCMHVVNKNGMMLQHIKYPSENIILAAIKQDSRAIQFVKNRVDLIHQNGMVIEFIDPKDLTDEMITVALKQNGHAIQFINEPQEWQMKLAIENKYSSIDFIRNKLTPELKEYAEQLLREAITEL
jgi:hypothetical protein